MDSPFSSTGPAGLLPIPCALCTEDPNPDPSSLTEDMRDVLRRHLIQSHSDAVATIILYPDPSIHEILSWIMAISNFGNSSIDESNDKGRQHPSVGVSSTGTDASSNEMSDGTEDGGMREENGMNLTNFNEEHIDDGIKAFDLKESDYGNCPRDATIKMCSMCSVGASDPVNHLILSHLEYHLFECSQCSFGSNERIAVENHIANEHPLSEADPIVNRERYRFEIGRMLPKCFPEKSQILVKNQEREIENSVKKHVKRMCELCKEMVSQNGYRRHIYLVHLPDARLFECPLCPNCSSSEIRTVKAHIRKLHKDHARAEVVSHEKEFEREISRLDALCFPGWTYRKTIEVREKSDSIESADGFFDGGEGNERRSKNREEEDNGELDEVMEENSIEM